MNFRSLCSYTLDSTGTVLHYSGYISLTMRILVVEDEEKLALSLQAGLEAEQYLSASVPLSSEQSFTTPGTYP